VARIRKDRYVIPEDADLVTGPIQFHASGSAHVRLLPASRSRAVTFGRSCVTDRDSRAHNVHSNGMKEDLR
jgi:hypothetical protein